MFGEGQHRTLQQPTQVLPQRGSYRRCQGAVGPATAAADRT